MNTALIAVFGPLAALALIVLVRRAAAMLALLGALAAALASWATLFAVASGATFTASLEWLPGLRVGVEVDGLAALLSAAVSGVGLLVFVYARGYMAGERDEVRFYAAMSLFLAAMQALVLAGDWLLFLASWELIALASYLLIGYWHQREDARSAAGRAFLTTRAADLGLYLAVFLLISETGSTSIAAGSAAGASAAAAAGLLMLLAAAAKAAQVPFQGWLAAAMAGPTPVSALLHSATLVAAGVILMLRAFPLLPAGVLLVVGLLGGITAVVAGLTALAQSDLKRLLAASTSSQLGLMLVALGAGSLAAAVFHLVAHAAMKSTLFLAAGVYQHERGSTEFRRLRGAGREQPLAFFGCAVAGLALAGVPPLSGFWSKDAVLAAAFEAPERWLLAPLALAGSLLTAMYVARALRLLWQGEAVGGSGQGEKEADPAGGLPRSGTELPSEGGAGEAHGVKDTAGTWMGAGLAGLAVAAAALGLLTGRLEVLLAAELPEARLAVVLGLVVAGAGLAAGWLLPPNRLLGGLLPLAEGGFRVAGGLAAITVRPVLRLASTASRLDRAIHSLLVTTAQLVGRVARAADRLANAIHAVVTSLGGLALALAASVSLADARLHRLVEGAGQGALAAARLTRDTDQEGIEELIAALARGTRALGRTGRRLQSGLVHRQLAITAASVAGLIVLLLTILSV